jgi:transcriptional regulatory protein RtcR
LLLSIRGDLALSALFGHKKGAFTGASQDAAGYIAPAPKTLIAWLILVNF